MKIDVIEIEKQVNKSGIEIFSCPVCKADSDHIIWGSMERATGLAWMDAECKNCGASWREDYNWAGISNLEMGG